MGQNELPKTKEGRVDWVIRAPDNSEMRRRYDVWAAMYDSDIGSTEDYLAPIETAKVAGDFIPKSEIVMDAGAGTGLVGEALRRKGFSSLVAVDYSEHMLAVARQKNVYAEFHHCDLSRPTGFADDFFGAVVSCGTTSQMPSASLREFARIVRPGGKIIFASVPEFWVQFGYKSIFDELEEAGQLSLVWTGEPFQMMPTTEPDFICEVLVMEVNPVLPSA